MNDDVWDKLKELSKKQSKYKGGWYILPEIRDMILTGKYHLTYDMALTMRLVRKIKVLKTLRKHVKQPPMLATYRKELYEVKSSKCVQ